MLLFLRPANGVYLPPQVLRLTGKSTVVPTSTSRRRTCRTSSSRRSPSPTAASTREVARNSSCRPRSACSTSTSCPRPTTYKPGQKAKVKLKLTDVAGKPFVGSTVLSIFDKSVEYISGGSNVPTSRSSSGSGGGSISRTTESSLDRWFDEPHAARPESRCKASACSATRWRTNSTITSRTQNVVDGICGRGGGRRRDGARRAAMSRQLARSRGRADDGEAPKRRTSVDLLADAPGQPQPRPNSSSRRSAPNSPTRPSGSPSLDTNADGLAEVALDMPRESHGLEDPRLGHGPRHARRRGVGRSRHPQEPHRPHAGPAVLRRARRSRAHRERPQLPARRQAGEGRASNSTATRSSCRPTSSKRSKFPPAASAASIGA